jgi:hypothetical protein
VTVYLKPSIKKALDSVANSGLYNPFDWPLLATELGSRGKIEASEWVLNHPTLFMRGVQEGFAAKEEDYEDQMERDIDILSADEWYDKYIWE